MPQPQANNPNPAIGAAVVAPSDGADLPIKPARGLWIGVGGDVVVDTSDGSSTILFKNVPSGYMLPVSVNRVRGTNTTATNIVAVY